MRLALLLLLQLPLLAGWHRFAEDGTLKMLYDGRMGPQAVLSGGKVHIAWRGERGLPRVRSFDLATATFSDPVAPLDGLGIAIDAARFERDHHYAPVIWAGADRRLHIAFGFHRTPGLHLVTDAPADISRWSRLPEISHSISYPQVHRIDGGRTLVYFRESGHLGSWTYRITADGGRTWHGPEEAVIDLDAPPQEGPMAGHAGSYHSTRVGSDGRTLHVAFSWKVEDPVASERYGRVLHDYTRRHNLYYVRTDLLTGEVFNAAGRRLPRPVNFGLAQRKCVVWDTEGRTASVGAAIELGADGEPRFLLPVSGDTPYASKFYFVRREDGEWLREPLAATGHPFNSGRLARHADGSFSAYLVGGDGEAAEAGEMNRYGWGERVERWVSGPGGREWRRSGDATPVDGLRYQNLKFVRDQRGMPVDGLLLVYGWRGDGSGTGFLFDGLP